MKIFVKAKPNSKGVYIKKIDESSFVVAVREPPVQGKANLAIIKALADYFNVSASRVKISSGWTSRDKVLEIS